MVNFGEFLKLEATFQTVLPDCSVLIEPKWVENANTKKFKCDVFGNFRH